MPKPGLGPMNTITREAAKPRPPAEDSPEAATFQWQPSAVIGLRIHNGTDSKGRLLQDTPATYGEAALLADIKLACAKDIQNDIRGVTKVQLAETAKSTFAQAMGSGLGVAGGFENPGALVYKQVMVLTAGTALGGSIYSTDLLIRLQLDSAYAQCTIESAKKESRILHRVVLYQVPLVTFDEGPTLAPGVEAPLPDDLEAGQSTGGAPGRPQAFLPTNNWSDNPYFVHETKLAA